MSTPRVSVIIPTYNYADYLHKAIDSVLDQTFQDFEVVVVDDGSVDHTEDVVQRYEDDRICYIYQENRGLPAARNTGIRSAHGDFLALLDADDQFHPEKLALQVAFLDTNPQVGLAYNGRIMVDSQNQPLFLYRAPRTVVLKDLVTDYHFAPSDIMVRREWAEKVSLYDDSFVLNSEDLNFHLRLALDGCQFAGLESALTYRQIHSGRIFKNISGKVDTYIRALDTAFLDPRCPPDVLALRDLAYANHYLVWGIQAGIQGEAGLAAELLKSAVALNPHLTSDDGLPLAKNFILSSIRDGGEHEERLRNIFSALPAELNALDRHEEWAVARGYLQSGIQDLIWSRLEPGRIKIEQSASRGAYLDQDLLSILSHQLDAYWKEFGSQAVRKVLQEMTPVLRLVGDETDLRRLYGSMSVNQAFYYYRENRFGEVPGNVIRAIFSNPVYLTDRGVLSILARSLVGMVR